MGFDIFIDDKMKAWVLEINDHPSLNILLCKEGPKGLIKEPSEVDKFIKVKVVGDAIRLMKSKKFPRSKRHLIESFGCWQRILPSDEGYEEDFSTFSKATYLFN